MTYNSVSTISSISAVTDALCAATYLEDVLDCMEWTPGQLQLLLSRFHELNVIVQERVQRVHACKHEYLRAEREKDKLRAFQTLRLNLCAIQDVGDEKLRLVSQLNEILETKRRQLEATKANLEPSPAPDPLVPDSISTTTSSTSSGSSSSKDANSAPGTSRGCKRGADGASKRGGGVTGRGSGATATPVSTNKNAESTAAKRKRLTVGAGTSAGGGPCVGTPSTTSTGKANAPDKKSANSARESGGRSGLGGPGSSAKKTANAGNAGKRKPQVGSSATSTATSSGAASGSTSRKPVRGNQTGSTPNAALSAIMAAAIAEADDDEARYCLCNNVSYGDMVACDNDRCEIEWFHYNCVAVAARPKGKWYCPKCRGDKPTVKRPDA